MGVMAASDFVGDTDGLVMVAMEVSRGVTGGDGGEGSEQRRHKRGCGNGNDCRGHRGGGGDGS